MNTQFGRPLTPQEAIESIANAIPQEVFDCFNDEIIANLRYNRSVVSQKNVVSLIKKKLKVSSDKIFDNHWMDVEEHYRKSGWKVTYDAPGFNETYEATYTFVK